MAIPSMAAIRRTPAAIDPLERALGPETLARIRPLIREIQRLKQETGAVVLAHNYQSPEVFHGVGDIRGDSLALAVEAARVGAPVIVVAGVHFMAETAALMNPGSTVLAPDPRAGCSLAESITPDDVRALRRENPGVPVVTYVNTSAAVKAESDICCTSANAVEIVESLGARRVLMVPDRHLARWVAANTDVEILSWDGACIVHEQLSRADVEAFRAARPGITVFAHPECPLDVLEAADRVGSTSAMVRFARDHPGRAVAFLTERSLAENLAAENGAGRFEAPGAVCPHMKRITLEAIRHALLRGRYRVEIDPEIGARARRAVERMVAVGRGRRG